MKQVSDLLHLNELHLKTVKVIYNEISNIYTLIDKDQRTIAQFNCDLQICVIYGYGYFMPFTEEQLHKVLKSKSDKMHFIGGHRAFNDSRMKFRKNDELTSFFSC